MKNIWHQTGDKLLPEPMVMKITRKLIQVVRLFIYLDLFHLV